MQFETIARTLGPAAPSLPDMPYVDPLDDDRADDAMLLVTRRSLLRMALVATETAARFTRERIDADPMAWMTSPRRLFGGESAIDACLNRTECVRAVLLHGLSLGLDAEPAVIDALAIDDEDEDGCDVLHEGVEALGGAPRLWTTFHVEKQDQGTVQAFEALIANDRLEAEARLRERLGTALADRLDIVEGFDASLPLAQSLLSQALADVLEQVAVDPASPLADGLVISVQQRFAT